MNIYVSGLSHQTTEADLRELFERFGQVDSAIIIKDKITREPRGFGFVEMGVNAEANAAINELNGSQYQGRSLKVNEARPREDNGGGPRGGGNDRPRSNYSQGGGGGNNGGRRDFRR